MTNTTCNKRKDKNSDLSLSNRTKPLLEVSEVHLIWFNNNKCPTSNNPSRKECMGCGNNPNRCSSSNKWIWLLNKINLKPWAMILSHMNKRVKRNPHHGVNSRKLKHNHPRAYLHHCSQSFPSKKIQHKWEELHQLEEWLWWEMLMHVKRWMRWMIFRMKWWTVKWHQIKTLWHHKCKKCKCKKRVKNWTI